MPLFRESEHSHAHILFETNYCLRTPDPTRVVIWAADWAFLTFLKLLPGLFWLETLGAADGPWLEPTLARFAAVVGVDDFYWASAMPVPILLGRLLWEAEPEACVILKLLETTSLPAA